MASKKSEECEYYSVIYGMAISVVTASRQKVAFSPLTPLDLCNAELSKGVYTKKIEGIFSTFPEV